MAGNFGGRNQPSVNKRGKIYEKKRQKGASSFFVLVHYFYALFLCINAVFCINGDRHRKEHRKETEKNETLYAFVRQYGRMFFGLF